MVWIPPKIQGKGRTGPGVHPCTIIKTAGWWGLSERLDRGGYSIPPSGYQWIRSRKIHVGKDASKHGWFGCIEEIAIVMQYGKTQNSEANN